MAELLAHTRTAQADPSVRVIVYTGAGERAFSAGGDLSSGFVSDPLGLHGDRGVLAELFRAMWRGGKPTVARVNGHALAGGFGLAVACDITVCVDDARLGTPEIDVGLWPMMITVPLIRAMPAKAVLELMMTGRIINPEEALRLGAVSRVVTRAELDPVVDEIVTGLAAKSPAVMMLGRDAFDGVVGVQVDAALEYLQVGLTAVALTEDSREGVAAFIEKRPPRWTGR
jgi:enoyl-CoA hydratase/carnithine racemase